MHAHAQKGRVSEGTYVTKLIYGSLRIGAGHALMQLHEKQLVARQALHWHDEQRVKRKYVRLRAAAAQKTKQNQK